jgi:hypothetical protein
LTQSALTRAGDRERGRKLFFDVDKSLCLRCHRLGDQGERMGPELTGVGSRFSRIYVLECRRILAQIGLTATSVDFDVAFEAVTNPGVATEDLAGPAILPFRPDLTKKPGKNCDRNWQFRRFAGPAA